MAIDFTPDTSDKIDFKIDFTPDEPITPTGVVGEFQGDPATILADIEKIPDLNLREQAKLAYAQQTTKPKTFMGDVLIPSLIESAEAPIPARAKPGLIGAAEDVAMGVPEAIGGLASGLGGFIAGQVGSATQIPGEIAKGAGPLEALAKGFDIAENVAAAGMYEPKTSTGRLLMKPIEAVFGTALGSIDKTVRMFSDPELPEEEIAKRSKAAQYVFNTALIGLPMIKSKFKSGEVITAKDKAVIKEEVKKVEPEFPDALSDSMLEKIRQEAISYEEAKADTAKAETKVAGQAKFPENQEIIDILQNEVDARTGKDQSRSRGAYVQARKIIEDYEGDITQADLSIIAKSKDAKTRKLVQEWVDKKNAKVVDDVPDFPMTDQYEIPPVVAEVKTVEPIPVEAPVVEAPSEVIPVESRVEISGTVEEFGTRNQYLENNPFKVETDKIRIKYAGKDFIPTEQELSIMRDAEGWEVMQVIEGNKPAFLNDTNIIHDQHLIDLAAEHGLVAGFRDRHLVLAKDDAALNKVIDAGNGRELGLALGYEDIRKPAPIEKVAPDGVVEKTPLQEFDTIALAKGEGYKIESPRYRTLERAQAKVGEGQEVIKVGKVFKVAEYIESNVPKFESIEQVEGFKVMGEVPRKVAENDVVEFTGDAEFKSVQVGDKYYRMERDVPIERTVKEVKFTPDEFDIEPTEFDLAKEEGGIREMVKLGELEVDPIKKAKIQQGVLDGYKRYKERYVEKINAADPAPKVTKPADLAVIKHGFEEFSSREEAKAYYEAKGVEANILGPDPETGKFYREPEFKDLDDYAWENGLEDSYESRSLDRWSDDPVDMELSDTGVQDLMSIFNNERGSIEFDATPLKIHVEKLRELGTLAERLGKSVPEVLESLGLSPEAINGYMLQIAKLPEDIDRIKKADPINESLINPEASEVIYQEITHNKKGTIKHIPITKAASKATFGARKIEFGPSKLGRFMQATETRLHGFERYGKNTKELFFDNWVKKLGESEKEKKSIIKGNKTLAKTLTNKERSDMSIAMIADQKGGKEALAADGIIDIPILNTKQKAVVKELRKQYDNFYDRINYIRSHVGLATIPKIDNYSTFIHQQNALRKAGIVDSLTYTPLKKLQGAKRKFSGTMFPFEKPRKVTDIPLELDVFNAMSTYLDYALKEIHISPIAALAKEVSTAIIKPEGKKGRGITLTDVNPGLAKFLLEWSDEILGIDTVTAAQKAKHPFITDKFNSLHRNIVAGMIFGNVGTVLKQPTAMIGTYAMTTLPDVVVGITKTALEKATFRKSEASRKSNILGIRRAELILTEFAEAVSQGHVKGVRKIVGDITSAPMNIVDALSAEASWNAGYRHAKKTLKMSEENAIQFAEDLVAKTQAVGIKGAVSPIQTTASLKWLTMLQTFAIADFNFLARDVLGIKNPDITKTSQVKRVLRYTIGAILVNEAFNAAGLDTPKPSPIRTFQEAQSEGDSDTVATAKAMKEFLELIPIIGGSAKFGSSLLGPVGELAQDIPDTLNQVTKFIDWDNTTQKEKVKMGMMVGEVLGLYYGIPMTRQIKKSIRTAIQGGDWYEIINGIYIKEKKGGPPGPPRRPKPPSLGE